MRERSLRRLLVGLTWVAAVGIQLRETTPTTPMEMWITLGLAIAVVLFVAAFASSRVRELRHRILTNSAFWGLLALIAFGCSLYWYVLASDYGLATVALLSSAVTTFKSLQERPLSSNRWAQTVLFLGSAGLVGVGLWVRTLGTKPSILALALVGVVAGLVGMVFGPRFLWN